MALYVSQVQVCASFPSSESSVGSLRSVILTLSYAGACGIVGYSFEGIYHDISRLSASCGRRISGVNANRAVRI